MTSSEGTRTTTSSHLSQFGIYKSIDARTEEFLRLSRKRQLRQGCACAALTTAITVTVVVVVLLIYEYAIAVESSLVQRIRNLNTTNATNDTPVADRLDRSYFGFDQDYFEKMPLLVNAMQENSDTEPTLETTTLLKPKYILTDYSKQRSNIGIFKPNLIRRTSPRPFYFEYKSPTPTPFSKTYGSKSWVDSYRNAQRLKNLQQVIKYLEKTINAKFGDMYALPTSTIAFSGLYVEPVVKEESQHRPAPPTSTVDLMSQDSKRVETVKSNHKSDLFYSFKPENPGDVNLLADGFFRFSPAPSPVITRGNFGPNIPMFRPITQRKKPCIGIRCLNPISAESKIINSQENRDLKVEATSFDKSNTFSVMLNLFPLKENDFVAPKETTPTPIHKIYITTAKPIVQFRRRSTTPIRTTTTRIKKPRFQTHFRTMDYNPLDKRDIEPKMIVHVNVYPPPEVKDQVTTESNIHTTLSNPPRYSTQMPMLTSTQVEDFHVGSSGIIPPEARLTPIPPPPPPSPIPTLPPVTTTIPYSYLETTSTSTESNFKATNPPDILRFSHEDAKVPDHYKKLLSLDTSTTGQPQINRRNSKDNVDRNVGEEEDYETDTSTIATKLTNAIVTTTQEAIEKMNEDNNQQTTIKTYVPQINGHYRSVNQNSKNINTWLNDNFQSNRKKRLEMSVTGFRKSTYVPQYVEIQRNNTRNTSDKEKDD